MVMFVYRVIDRVRPEEKRRHNFCFKERWPLTCSINMYIHICVCPL